jgi:hypothetical protein
MGISRDKLEGRIRSHEGKSSWFRIRVINLKGTTVTFDGFRSTLTIKNREGKLVRRGLSCSPLRANLRIGSSEAGAEDRRLRFFAIDRIALFRKQLFLKHRNAPSPALKNHGLGGARLAGFLEHASRALGLSHHSRAFLQNVARACSA